MRVMILLFVFGLLVVPAKAGVDECREAISTFRSARSEVADALRAYASCISNSDGHDDCSSEFSALHSAQDDFESATSSYESECP